MIKIFPDDRVASVYDVDWEQLYSDGIRGVIFDVDNTLVTHGAPADSRATALFSELDRIGFKSMLLSNNGEARVASFAKDVVYTDYIYKAKKPSVVGYERACETMDLDRSSVIFFGDQIFTDVYGARRSGIRAILVKPIAIFREEIQIVFKRFLEAPIKCVYKLYRLIKGSDAYSLPIKIIME